MDKRYTLSSLTTVFSTSCIFCTLFYLMTLNQGTPNLYYPQVLLCYTPLLFLVNTLFLRKSRTMRSFALIDSAFGLALFLSIVFVESGTDWLALLFAGIFCMWLTIVTAQMSLAPPKLSHVILSLDISLGLLVVFTGYTAYTGISVLWCIPIVAGSASAILGMISYRAGGGLGLRGWSVVTIVFLALFGFVFLLVTFVAAPAGAGVVTFWNALLSVAGAIGSLLWRILYFFLSLLPSGDESSVEPLPDAVEMPAAAQESIEMNPTALMVLAAFLLIGIFLLILWLLRRIGRLRIGGSSVSLSGATLQRQRISLRKGLLHLLAAIRRSLHLRLVLWRCRNQPAGLYYLIVRRCHAGPWHKKAGETPKEFLLRLKDAASGDPQLSAALSEIIPQVDKALFSPGPSSAAPLHQSLLIRRRIRRAVLLQFLKSLGKRRPKKSQEIAA